VSRIFGEGGFLCLSEMRLMLRKRILKERSAWEAKMTNEERELSQQLQKMLGAKIVNIRRQARWRKCWFVDIEREGKTSVIYIRGDKQIDAEVYPGLEREAGILKVFAAQGVPVPHVYGMTQDPETIVMEHLQGTRDVSLAANDAERKALSRQYMDVLASIHALNPALFAPAINAPSDPRRVPLAYLDANLPLYNRTRRGAQPLAAFLLKWLERNLPEKSVAPRFVLGDPGQFLFADGRITGIYDFEAAHIGDPLADLAALRLREGTEPFGVNLQEMLVYYAERTGMKIDSWMLSYHTVAFALTTIMSLAGPLDEMKPNDLQLEYLIWDLTIRRGALWALAECMGETIEPISSVPALTGFASRVPKVLEGTVARITGANDIDKLNLENAIKLAQWSAGLLAVGREAEEADINRVAAIVGRRPANWRDAEKSLEEFVLAAGPDQDVALFRHFALQTEAQVAAAHPIRDRLDWYALKRIKF
jgi:aminoglycoside phosphotransferase (APT) family kinase protein